MNHASSRFLASALVGFALFGAAAGWTTGCSKDAETELLDASFPNGSGTATYRSADGSRAVTLAWNVGNPITAWSGTWAYADNLNGSDSGAWDGGDVFSVGMSTVLSLAPAPTAPRHGPGQIAWDGTILVFDSVATFMAGGDDVYRDSTGSELKDRIDRGHPILAWSGYTTVAGRRPNLLERIRAENDRISVRYWRVWERVFFSSVIIGGQKSCFRRRRIKPKKVFVPSAD